MIVTLGQKGAIMAKVTTFGTTAQGEEVRRITMQAGDLTVSVLTWGAVLQSVRLKGVAHDLTLGSDLLADYEGDMRHHGSIIAPVVNRLSGAQAVIAGRLHRFEANQDGRNCLHGGGAGTHLKVWDLVSATASETVLAIDLPDGEGGFPGNRRIEARFALVAPAALRLSIRATTDAPTIFNAANHSYWNLDGSETWDGHAVQVAADHYLPADADFVVTGEIRPVTGDHDLRQLRPVSPHAPDLDNCYCLGRSRIPLRDVLRLQGTSGLSMVVASTEPGVQLYDGRNAIRPGHGPYEGLAIEAQGWPDAPNQPGFPPIDLAPGAVLTQVTEWRFARH